MPGRSSRAFAVAAVLLGGAASAGAQSIEGVVRDATGLALPGVTVEIWQGQVVARAAPTEAEGRAAWTARRQQESNYGAAARDPADDASVLETVPASSSYTHGDALNGVSITHPTLPRTARLVLQVGF